MQLKCRGSSFTANRYIEMTPVGAAGGQQRSVSRLQSGTRLLSVPLCGRSTRIGRRFAVHTSVSIALVAAREAARTHLTGIRFLTCMSSYVSRQVISPAERAAADGARERPLTAMHTAVPRQLVATGETATAVRHRARESLDGRPCTDWRHAITTTASSRWRRHLWRSFVFQFLCGR